MILLCLTQSSIEKLTINYQWGLHDKKIHKDKAIYLRKMKKFNVIFQINQYLEMKLIH